VSIMAGAYLLASLRAPALTVRFGRSLAAAGALILAAGHGVLLLTIAELGVRGHVLWLAPGLVLIGAGMGLCLTALNTSVLVHATPQTAGAISGAMSTTQQVGNALGVAVTGVIFFGALPRGYGHAMVLSLAELAVLLVTVAALTRLLPRAAR
jgi:hypothetical protein